jgi:hypothetical protein
MHLKIVTANQSSCHVPPVELLLVYIESFDLLPTCHLTSDAHELIVPQIAEEYT